AAARRGTKAGKDRGAGFCGGWFPVPRPPVLAGAKRKPHPRTAAHAVWQRRAARAVSGDTGGGTISRRRRGTSWYFFTGPLHRPFSQPQPVTIDFTNPAMPYAWYITPEVHSGSFQRRMAFPNVGRL